MEITKTWDDAADKSHRPTKEQFVNLVTLKADGVTTTAYTPTVTEDTEKNTYTVTWTGLPKNKRADGVTTPITYTVEENLGELQAYYNALPMTGSDGKFAVTNEVILTEATIKKFWNVKPGEEKLIPDDLTVALLANGEPALDETGSPIKVTLTANDDWTQTVENLPKYQSVKDETSGETTVTKIEYTWSEENLPEGFALTDTSTSEDGTEITLTNSYIVPEFDKKTKDINDTTGEPSEWQDSADYDIGDEVPFRLTAILPDTVTSFTKYDLTFTDAFEKGLTFNKGSVTVTLKNDSLTDYPLTDYTLTADDSSMELALTWGNGTDKITDPALNGAEVIVEYTAKLNDNAVLGKEGNANNARLNYSNNPADTGSHLDTDGDSAIIFTYGLTFNKVDDGDNEVTGAEFKLEKKLADGTLKPVDLSQNGSVFTAKGLDDGEYVLTETKTPDGHVAIDPITFTVTADHKADWGDSDKRTDILESLNGDVENGVIALSADAELANLTGKVVNTAITKSTVTKIWNDNGQENLRGDTIKVQLLANNKVKAPYDLPTKEGATAPTVTDGEYKWDPKEKTWSLTISNLPAYENGDKIVYSWIEKTDLLPEGYSMTDLETTVAEDGSVTTKITNSYQTERICLTVLKVWDDANDQDGLRREVTVDLMKKVAKTDETGAAVLDKEENPTYEYVAVTDAKDAKGTPIQTTGIKLNADNNWTYLVKGLPKSEGGVDIEYAWFETAIDGYNLDEEGVAQPLTMDVDKTTRITALVNVHAPEETEIHAKKIWDDNDNQDGKREDVTLRLIGEYTEKVGENGETVTRSVYIEASDKTIKAGATGDALKVSWDHLPVKMGGNPVTYKVIELKEANNQITMKDGVVYTVAYGTETETVGEGEDAVSTEYKTVTNTHTPEEVDVEITKTWDDAANVEKLRLTADEYKSIVSLYQGNAKLDKEGEVTDNGDGTYTVKFAKLPKYERNAAGTASTEISYTVQEDLNSQLIKDKYTVTPADGKAANGGKLTNKLNRGDLEISKTVVSAVPADQNQDFEFTITLKVNGKALGNVTYSGVTFDANGVGKIKLHGGETKTLEGLPVGTAYTVTETAVTGFTNTVKTGDIGTISATTKATAAFKNERDQGDLTISKTVVSPIPAEETAEYTFDILLNEKVSGTYTVKGTEEKVTFTDGKATGIKVQGRASKTIEGLPAGVTYTVVEAENSLFITASEDAAGTITKDGAEAKFTNTRRLGDLEVTKTVVSSNSNDKTRDFNFTVTLGDTTIGGAAGKAFGDMTFKNGVATFTLQDGQTATATGLPVGVTYTVEEETADGFVTTKVGETGTICTAKSIAAFTNTKTEGGLVVSKKVISAVTGDHDKPFTVTVTLDDKTITGKYGDAVFKAAATGSAATLSLKDGDVAVITGLPDGMGYTVSETLNDEDGKVYTVRYTGETGKIAEKETTSALVTNTRKTAKLTITKTLKSDLAADKDKAFLFTLKLDQPVTGAYNGVYMVDGIAKLWLKGGESVTIKGIPVGTAYTVTETADEDFVTTVDDAQTHVVTGTVTVKGEDNTPVDVTANFTNTRKTGDLEVTKTVESHQDGDKTRDFNFTVTLSDTTIGGAAGKDFGDLTFTNGVATFELQDGEKATAKGLPVGVTYTVEEATPTGYVLTKTGETGTISTEKATATFTNKREEVEASVLKVWDDADNQDGKRPDELKVELNADGVKIDEVTLEKADNWAEKKVENLPKYSEAGNEVQYTWSEGEMPDGYSLKSNETVGMVTTITNTHTPETTSATVKKAWDVDEDHTDKQPETLILKLLANDPETGKTEETGRTVTLTKDDVDEEGNWTATLDNLPKYKNGKEIVYTWAEDSVPAGYQLKDNTTKGQVTTITNTFETGKLTISKKFLFNGEEEIPDGVEESKLLKLKFTLTGPEWDEPQSLTYRDIKGGKTYENIVPGNYTLTEEEGAISLLADENYTLDVTSSKMSGNADVTVGATDLKIELTNNYKPDAGSLEIAKEWCFSPVPATEEDKKAVEDGRKTLQVTVKNSEGKYVNAQGELSDKEELLTIENGSRLTLNNLPIDTYTITEKNAADLFTGLYTLTSAADQSVTVEVKNKATVTAVLKNNYSRDEGELILQKTVENITEGEDLSAIDAEQLNNLTFRITGVSDPSFEMTVTYADFEETKAGVKTKTVKVPVGTYKVEELNETSVLDEYTWMSGETLAENLKVTKDGPPRTAELKNVYKKNEGQLIIRKTFIGAPTTEAAEEAKKSLVFTITGPSFLTPKTITYADFVNGQYILPNDSVKNLIVGTYTVTEELQSAEGLLTAFHYTLDASSVTSGEAKVTSDGPTALIHLTNKYNQTTASLEIVKNFTGVPEGADVSGLNFHITGPDGFDRNVSYAAFTGGKYKLDGLALGDYTVKETNADTLLLTYGYGLGASATEVTTTLDAKGAAVTLTNNYEQLLGSLTIVKNFNDPDLADFSNLNFRIIGPNDFTKDVPYSKFTDGRYTESGLELGQYLVYETNAGYLAASLTLLEGSVTAAQAALTLEERDAEVELTNNYEQATTSAMVMKVWNDKDDLDGSRPDELVVTLTGSDGTNKTVTLNEANGWKHEETDLPLYSGDTLITYTWSEQPNIVGYTMSGYQVSGNVTVFTNTHTPEMVTATVVKIWDDNNNAANLRPAVLRVTLFADGVKKQDYTLSVNNNWTTSVTDLPKYMNGNEVKYTWSEQSVVGYTSSITTTGTVTTFINSYRTTPPPSNPPRGGTPPTTPEKPPVYIEDYETPLGIEVLINHVGDCFD